MNRTCFAPFVLLCAAATNLVAAEQPGKYEQVRWRPDRNVKDAVYREIAQFEKDLKTDLGPEILAFKPYVALENHTDKAALEETTIEQMVDRMLQSLRKWGDHDNEEYVPAFAAYRRVDGGRDIASAPKMLTAPGFGGLSGNITFKVEWEHVDGRFLNNWDHDDVDEVYEVELNGTLTLGIKLSTRNDRKLTMISYSVTKPIVTGWRILLVASKGEVHLPAKRPN